MLLQIFFKVIQISDILFIEAVFFWKLQLNTYMAASVWTYISLPAQFILARDIQDLAKNSKWTDLAPQRFE